MTTALNEIQIDIINIMPPAAQAIYYLLQTEKQLSLSDICLKTEYSRRTVHNALSMLEQAHLIKKLPDLSDMRKKTFLLKS